MNGQASTLSPNPTVATTRSARSAKTSSKSKKKSSTSTQAATNPKKGGVGGKANSSKKNPRICTRKNLQLDTDDEYNSSNNQEETVRTGKSKPGPNDPPQTERNQSPPHHNNLVGLTLENFGSQLDSWSIQQLRQASQQNKDIHSNWIPPEVQDALTLLKQNYIKSKLMLALIGHVSEATVNKSLGKNKPPRRKCSWNRFLAFSLESAKTPVPPRGCPVGWDERNTHLGNVWSGLSKDEKSVFSAAVFQYFSKIPCQVEEDDDNDEEEMELTPYEIELYEPLYRALVNQEKVDLIILKGSNSGINNAEAFKQAEKRMQNLNKELFNASNLYNTTYYLLTATRKTGANSFCREWSNNAAWLTLAEKKWKAKEQFEAYSHGQDIQDAVEEANGVCMAKKKKPADKMKTDLRAALNKTLATALGVSVEGCIFPKQKDPVSILRKKHPHLRIVLSEGSQLKAEELMAGFDGLQFPKRKQWLADIKSGAFQILPIEN